MNNYNLSIIIPNYNKEKFIGKCIESIMEQTLIPDKIIIVDDCSTDNSASVIRNYEQKYKNIKGIYLKANKGVSNARNVGLAAAETEYVSFTDSDDFYYNKDKLKNEMNIIKKYKSENIDVVAYSAIVRVDNEGKKFEFPLLKKYNFMKNNIFLDLYSKVNWENIPRDYCISKKILEKVGAYSYKENYYEDLDLLFRLSLVVKFKPTYQYGIAYRQTPNGLSKRSDKERRAAVTSIIKSYDSYLSCVKRVYSKFKFVIWKVIRKLKILRSRE